MRRRIFWLTALLLLTIPWAHAADRTPAEVVYFAMEVSGKLVGYSETSITRGEPGGKPAEEITTVLLLLKALGQDFDVRVVSTRQLDAATGKTVFLDNDITQGGQKLGNTCVFDAGRVTITPKAGGAPKVLPLADDVIVDDSLAFPYLIRDFSDGEPNSKTYKVLEVSQGEIHDVTYTLQKTEKLHLLEREFVCLLFDGMDRKLGLSSKLWIDRDTGRAVRSEAATGIVSYLADSTVKMMIVRGDLDERLLAVVDTSIPDMRAITRMKIRAKIRTYGEWVTPESLNVPGQTFAGTVEENLIDGVFEIAHPKYDGEDAPPFPADFTEDEDLAEFLAPAQMIEADDPVLIEKARELTAGATNCWEAMLRLSRWVASEVTYEIPGGSARHTFDTRKGECGSHSRLMTAFCRGVGIPARLVSGCMYTPLRGGSFGQHAWNEIYMGKAGWITLDTTAKEVDYVDSGHIRLGGEVAFNPVEMKVLDFEAGALTMAKQPQGLRALGEVPFEPGETYVYNFVYRGSPIGSESFSIVSHDQTIVGGVYTCSSRIELPGVLGATVTYRLTDALSPLEFKTEGKVRGVDFSLEATFDEAEVRGKVMQGGQTSDHAVALPEQVYLMANNNVSLLAFIALASPHEEGETRVFKAFHPQSMQVIPCQVTVKGRETITWKGSEVECRILEASLSGTPVRMWLDEEGWMLRESEQDGALVMELAGH
ncbi:MAG: transglutaminase domain-containing protein [Planctomycetota bacterium]